MGNTDIKKILYALLIIFCIYLLFFTSKLYIHEPLREESKIGDKISYMQNRSVTLVHATYDKDKKEMEVQLDLDNNSNDNIDEYYYIVSKTEGSSEDIKVQEVYNKPMYTVLRIKNLKGSFREISLFVAPKIADIGDIGDSDYVELVLNKNNIKYMALNDKYEIDYLRERHAMLIKEKEDHVKKMKLKIKKHEEELYNIRKSQRDYKENIDYLTDEEKASYEDRIKSNKEEENLIEDKIKNCKKRIKTDKEDIKKLKNMKINWLSIC